MKRTRKILSCLLCLCMVLSVMPINVFAARFYNTGSCGALLNDGVLTISGEGSTGDHNNYIPQPWLTQIDSIHTVIINDDVTGIGNNTFKYMRALKNVTIGKNVADFGSNAFLGCENLENIYWNATNAEDLSQSNTIFSECGTSANGITVAFGESVEYIPANLFWSTTTPKIKKVVFNGPVEIGYNAFALCGKVDVHISSVEDWCQSTFKSTDSNPLIAGSSLYLDGAIVKDIKTANTLKEIKDMAFIGCTSIETITIKDGLTKIGQYAFTDCSNIKEVYLPKSLKNIGRFAFDIGNGKNLDIYYAGTEAEWNAISKDYYLDTDLVNLTMHYNEIYEKKDFEGITLEDAEYTYDGTEKSVVVSGVLPEGATVDYVNNKATNAGTYDVTATVKALGYYDLTLNATLKVNPKTLTVSNLVAQDKNYDGTDKAILSNASLAGKIEGDDVSANIPTEGKFANKNVGDSISVSIEPISLTGVDKDNYTLVQPSGLKAKITKAPITVKANDKQIRIGDAIPALDYAITNGALFGEDTLEGALTTNCSSTATAREYIISQGTLTAGSNYDLTFVKGKLTVVDKTPQNVGVDGIVTEKTYGDEGFEIAVTPDEQSNLNNFEITSSNTDVATVDESGNVTIKNAGSTTISVNEPGNADYAPFEKTWTLTVNKVDITVTADAKQKRIGTDDPALTYTYTGMLVGTDAFTGDLARESGEEVGTYDILQGTLALSDNYNITYNKATFEILEKTPQNIVIADIDAKTYGDTSFAITVTPDTTANLSNFTYDSSNKNVATIDESGNVTIVGAGETIISVTEAGNEDYAKTTVTKKLTVNKKALEIKVDNVTITYGDAINTNITYTGFVNGEDETVLAKDVEVSGYSAKPNVGEHDIILSGAEAANYEISYVNAKLTVNKKDVTVTQLKVFDKVADTTTDATINTSSLVIDSMILGDDVTINFGNAVATFATAEVGTDIAVTITALELVGTHAENYNLTNTEITTTASIKETITASDIAAQITALTVVKDSTEITLPNVPTGYKVTVKSSDNENVVKDDGSVAPVENDTQVGLTFTVTNEVDETDVANTVVINVTIPASTKINVAVRAEANGTVTGSGEYLKNADVTVVATPDSGYKFSGWYNGETSVSTNPSYTFKAVSDIALVAKFAKKTSSGGGGGGVSKYTVKFETNGGSTVKAVSVNKNALATEPAAPTKDGFNFDGWYTDKELTKAYDFSSKVTKGFTLYAKWTGIEKEPVVDEPDTTIAFIDVDENDWFYANVQYVVENKLMNGVAEDKFAPNDTLTRAMLVTVLYRNAGEPAVNKSIPFADVDMGSWYANAVVWAKQNGIVNGVTEIEFAPDENITREQIAAIMFRYAQYKGMDAVTLEENLHFTDADEISEYAVSAMNWAVGTGLMKGKSTTTINPKDNATRAEIAAILQRFIENNK